MNTKLTVQRTKVILLGLITATIFSCSQADYKEELYMEDAMHEEAPASFEITPVNQVISGNNFQKMPANLKIIKTATTRYKVDDIKKATAAIKTMADTYGAYISELKFNNNLYEKQNRFTIKVPNAHFDTLMDTISGMAALIEYETITTKDVTEEFMDVTARLKTKQEVKKRYEEVLRKRAVTVEDILMTEDKLRVIQEEIESAQGRLKYLSEKVAYSTIHVDLFETVTYKEEPESYTKTFVDKAKNGFSNGWSIVEVLILGLITIWPLLLMGVFIWLIIKVYLRKRKG